MDSFTLDKLEFDRVRQVLGRYCRCSLGRGLAARIAPSRRPETVQTWLAQTSEMVATLREVGTPPYAGITDIADPLERAKPGGGPSAEDFAVIASTLVGCGNVRAWLLALGEAKPLLIEFGQRLDAFDGEVRAIQAVVDERGQVRDDASERLASIRRQIDEAQTRIRETVYSFVRRGDVAQYLQSTSVQLHEDRYVLPVRAEHRGRLAGVVHRASHTGATIFVEPAECVELNNRLVRLGDEQREEIARLLSQLAIRVHGRYEQIRQSLQTLALVDLVTAKAQYAHQFDMTCPEVTERGALSFFQARHPLLIEQAYQQEMAGLPADQRHPVVPIDVRLGQDFDVLIITGSNTGGKTVAMKTVGLLALMTQSGLHIPVQRGATMPVFRDVFIDVGDEQSLEQSLSTFGAHLKRIRHIVLNAGRYSLVLLDELGSGTDPDEGGAIGQAVLDELRELGCLAMVTTHLGVLKAYAYNHQRVDNASVEFDTETLRPTYRLLMGRPGESHAITVARALGLPKRLVHNARNHLPRQARQLNQAIRATVASRKASEEALSEAQAAKVEAQTQQELYETKLSDLQRLGEQFREWLGSLPALQPGDPVFVRRLNKPGKLVRLQLTSQLALVDVENMHVEVPVQELMPELGAPHSAEEIATLRRQLGTEVRQAVAVRDEAEKARQEYHRSLAALRARQRQFDDWLAAVVRLNVGEEVAFGRAPGRGKLVEMDLPGGRVIVETAQGKVQVPLQELHANAHGMPQPPQGAQPRTRQRERPPRGDRRGRDRRPGARPVPEGDSHPASVGEGQARGPSSRPGRHQERDNRPMMRRSPESQAAKATRAAVLAIPPGEEVYVVPFQKRATLLRIDQEKGIAVVSSGAFEMQLPLADLEPVRP